MTPRARRSACLRWRTTTSACTTRKRLAMPTRAAVLEDTETNIDCFAGCPSDGITGSLQEGGDQPRTRERADRGANTEPRPAEQGGRHEEGSWGELIDGGRRHTASRCTFEAEIHQSNRIKKVSVDLRTPKFPRLGVRLHLSAYEDTSSVLSRGADLRTCLITNILVSSNRIIRFICMIFFAIWRLVFAPSQPC